MLKGHKHILIPKYYKDLFLKKTAKATIAILLTLITILFLGTANNTYATTYSSSLSTSGNITLNIIPRTDVGDTIAIGSDTLTAITTCPLGYNLSIRSSSASANLYLDGDTNNSTANDTIITPVNGTNTLSSNTWGYSLTSTSATGVFTGLTGTATSLGDGTKTSTLDGSALFSDTATSPTGDTIPIYYGVKVSNMAKPGDYYMENDGSIEYLMTINPSCMVYTIQFNANNGTGTMADQNIYEGLPTNLNPNTFTAPTNYEFKEWNTKADGTGTSYTDQQQVTDIANVTETLQLYAIWQLKTYTCTKRYRLQNADGTYPSSYTSDGSETIAHGSTCSYSKSVTDYQTKSTSTTMTGAATLSLDLPRNTYALTINRNTTYISSVSGAGTYRWGQSVSISATPASNFNGWSQTAGTTGSFGSTSSASTTFTMPKSVVTIYADGKATQSSCPSSPMLSTVASGITYMQNINSSNSASVLSKLAVGSTYQIIDNRDNETYCVGKLADGKLWLLDNLALDLTNPTVLNGMNENNTHASNTTLGYLKGTTARDPSTDPDGQYATAKVSNWTSGRSYSAPLVNMTNKDVVPTDATSQAGQYKVGGYYNYCATSAGSYCYGNGTDWGTSSGNATEDICPKGWRMPTGSTSGEYSALANTIYGSTDTTSDATAYANYRSTLRLPLSGYFNKGSAIDQGSSGGWWSSTRRLINYMYHLGADTSSIYPATGNFRYIGSPVRCVLGS